MKVENEKVGLKLNIQKIIKIMASGPITSWEIEQGHGTLIPSAQHLVWATKQALGNAGLGALFA